MILACKYDIHLISLSIWFVLSHIIPVRHHHQRPYYYFFIIIIIVSFVCLLFFPLSPIFYFADFLPTSIKDKLKRKRINFGRLDCGTGSQLIISKVRLGPMICGGVWPALSGSLIDSRPVIHLNLWPGRLPPVYKDGFHRRTGYHTTGIFRSSQTAVSNSVT